MREAELGKKSEEVGEVKGNDVSRNKENPSKCEE